MEEFAGPPPFLQIRTVTDADQLFEIYSFGQMDLNGFVNLNITISSLSRRQCNGRYMRHSYWDSLM